MPSRAPDTLFEWALAVAGGATFIVFAVALQNFFVQPPQISRGQRFFQDLSVVMGLTHAIALLTVDTGSEAMAGVGVAMYTLSLGVFLGAIEAARRVPLTRTFVYEPRPNRIVREGPYRLIRHPIYLAYALAWLAAPVAMRSLALGATAVGMIACYILSAREEERRILAGPLGPEYATYARATRRFIPFVY